MKGLNSDKTYVASGGKRKERNYCEDCDLIEYHRSKDGSSGPKSGSPLG